MTVLWALSRFDLYALGLEQVGLAPHKVLYAQGTKDAEVLALPEIGAPGVCDGPVVIGNVWDVAANQGTGH